MEDNEIVASAKAAEKIAELGIKSLNTGERVGKFLSKVFKEPLEEASGILSDKLKFLRQKNWVNMAIEADRILLEKGIHTPDAVPLKLGIPIFEDENIQKI